MYYRSEATADPNKIEWAINTTYSKTISVYPTVFPNGTVSPFTYSIKENWIYHVQSAYQKLSGKEYSPKIYGLRYLNDIGWLLATENNTLSYFLSSAVLKDTGEITLDSKPYGAAKVFVTAYYSESNIYSWTGIPFSLPPIRVNTTDFYPSASTWEIGGSATSGYSIVGQTEQNNLSLWELRNDQNVDGSDNASRKMTVEKTTGLVVQDSETIVKNKTYYLQSYEEATDYPKIIPNGIYTPQPATNTYTTPQPGQQQSSGITQTGTTSSAKSPVDLTGIIIGLSVAILLKKKIKRKNNNK